MPRRELRAFPLHLRQSAVARFGIGFCCADLDTARKRIEMRGIEVVSTDQGPAFVDMDGVQIGLLPAARLLP